MDHKNFVMRLQEYFPTEDKVHIDSITLIMGYRGAIEASPYIDKEGFVYIKGVLDKVC